MTNTNRKTKTKREFVWPSPEELEESFKDTSRGYGGGCTDLETERIESSLKRISFALNDLETAADSHNAALMQSAERRITDEYCNAANEFIFSLADRTAVYDVYKPILSGNEMLIEKETNQRMKKIMNIFDRKLVAVRELCDVQNCNNEDAMSVIEDHMKHISILVNQIERMNVDEQRIGQIFQFIASAIVSLYDSSLVNYHRDVIILDAVFDYREEAADKRINYVFEDTYGSLSARMYSMADAYMPGKEKQKTATVKEACPPFMMN